MLQDDRLFYILEKKRPHTRKKVDDKWRAAAPDIRSISHEPGILLYLIYNIPRNITHMNHVI